MGLNLALSPEGTQSKRVFQSKWEFPVMRASSAARNAAAFRSSAHTVPVFLREREKEDECSG